MNEEQKEKIILKDDQPRKVEVAAGGKSIIAIKGKPVEVPLKDLELWLETGRFEWVQKEQDYSDLPQNIPGRVALKTADIDMSKLVSMSKSDLEGIPNIGGKTADAILEFLKNGGNN